MNKYLLPFIKVDLVMLICIFITGNVFAQYPTLPYHPNTVEPGFYPAPASPFQYNDWITNVTFAGINNTTAHPSWRNNYSGTTHASVVRGQSYTISVTVNAAGADFSFQYIGAFIDWDRNGDCGGRAPGHGGTGAIAGEGYDIGSGAGHSNPVSLSITVPNNAAIGTTWLRVTLKADGLPATDTYLGYFGYGEIEEYALDVYYAAPTSQASSILLPSNAAGTQLNISWTNGNGTGRAVFMKQGTGAITNPSNNTTYTASTNWSAKGTQLGSSGYYCIYNGTGNSVAVTNTTANTQYTIQVFEYNNPSGHEQYFTSTATGNPNNETSLPVELKSFTASTADNKIILNWQTATEINNYGFEVERSRMTDVAAEEWNTIGFVKGSGNSNSIKEYSFTDLNLSADVNLKYRLKQVDNDGSFTYSKEIEILSSAPSTLNLLQNYPNPFNPTTVISYQLPVNCFVSLKVYDMTGNEVASLVNREQQAGSHTATFNASGIATGIYFYRIQAGDFVSMKKLILLK